MAKHPPQASYLHELRYPANLLTLVRLGLLWPTLHYLRQPDRSREALACMYLAMLTDALDGPVARWRGEVSRLGKILDPLADKLVLDSTALVLVETRGFPRWVARLLIARDLLIVLAALVLYRRKAHIAVAEGAGKATTVGLTLAVILYTADGPRSGKPVLLLALVPFGLSLWQYGRRFLRQMRHM